MQRGGENERYVIGDVDHLPGCGVGKGFSFYLDMGRFHSLHRGGTDGDGQGRHGALAEEDATVCRCCASSPQRNPMVPRGADADDARRALPGWTLLRMPARLEHRRHCPALSRGMRRSGSGSGSTDSGSTCNGAAWTAVLNLEGDDASSDVEQHPARYSAALDGVRGPPGVPRAGSGAAGGRLPPRLAARQPRSPP